MSAATDLSVSAQIALGVTGSFDLVDGTRQYTLERSTGIATSTFGSTLYATVQTWTSGTSSGNTTFASTLPSYGVFSFRVASWLDGSTARDQITGPVALQYGGDYFGNTFFSPRYFGDNGAEVAAVPEDITHTHSRWRVDICSGNWQDPVYDSDWDAVNLTTFTIPSGTLTEGTCYKVQVCYLYSDGSICCGEEQFFQTVGPPPICPALGHLKRIEIWTDLESAGGVRVWFLSPHGQANTYHSCKLIQEFQNRQELRIEMDRDTEAWDYIRNRYIVRLVDEDDNWTEWRIVKILDERDGMNATTAGILAWHPMIDLADITARQEFLDGPPDADGNPTVGSINYSFGQWSLFPSEHVDAILRLPDVDSWWVRGTVEPTSPRANDRYSMDYTNGSPLNLLRSLAGLTDTKLLVHRSGSTGYLVHLLNDFSTICPRPEIRYRKNELGMNREKDTTELVTRVSPLGGELDGINLTIGEAQWFAIDVFSSNASVTLDGGPILFDDQLNGTYAEVVGTNIRYQVLDTIEATQTVLLESVAAISSVDTYLTFRVDANGQQLTYLDNPEGIATFGAINPPQDIIDLPHVDNYAVNAFLNDWDADLGLPVDWAAVGSPTISAETRAPFVLHGQASALVVCDSSAEGIETGWSAIFPSTRVFPGPYFTVQTNTWVQGGQIRLELLVDTGSEVISLPTSTKVISEGIQKWDPNLAAQGFDLLAIGAKFAKIRITSWTSTAKFYVDAVLLTQTAGGETEFFEGLASNELWIEGLRILAESGDEIRRYETDVADLWRLDRDRYPFDQFAIGAKALLVDNDPFGINVELDQVAIEWNFVDEGDTRLELSKQPDALTRFLARERSGRRRAISRPPGEGGDPENPGDPGSTGSGGQLSGFGVQVRNNDPSATDQHIVSWSHNQTVEDNPFSVVLVPPIQYRMNLIETVYDLDGATVDPGAILTETTLFRNRDPRLEDDGTNSITRFGSYEVDVDFRGTSPGNGGARYSFVYTGALKDGGVIVQTEQASITGYYVIAE
jgi:hypothetical protein